MSNIEHSVLLDVLNNRRGEVNTVLVLLQERPSTAWLQIFLNYAKRLQIAHQLSDLVSSGWTRSLHDGVGGGRSGNVFLSMPLERGEYREKCV
jgi:hypothetical protein